ncbi:hypothetical protein [Amorphus orientalis]|uniref:Uncharacterized protein n=1 Tax=Amorphus orientalis TaxID=649198 RepID=A0AAE3VTK5_9HYPH|nr:hypothetical protein [Amorphus orientalis]MDQ0317361.1 hypothetical protein [Amorphus orientalis]
MKLDDGRLRAANDNVCPNGGKVVRLPNDGPSIEHRIKAQAAWVTSQKYSGQVANDNQDWPLAKLLKTEGHERHLRLAERYRRMYENARAIVELAGRDPGDDIYQARRTDLDPSTGRLVDKGVRAIGPAKGATGGRRLRTDPSDPWGAPKPTPKPWNGEWVVLERIDAQRALARAQAALGVLQDAFEAAVVGNDTLEEIGRAFGVGNKSGAKGAGRALVFLGFDAVEAHWRRERAAA